VVSQGSLDRHLQEDEIVAFVDGVLVGEERTRVQEHLVTCAQCRAEIVEVSSIVRALPASRRAGRHIWIPSAAAAAAAVVLLLAWPPPSEDPNRPERREEAVTTTVAPRPVTPLGGVDSAAVLVWTSVPHADRYRVRLFDSEGTVIWQAEIEDTVARVPTSATLKARLSYYWKVEAHTGFDRWAASDLVEFIPRHGNAQ
jgi:anti-sigma factor RsiW